MSRPARMQPLGDVQKALIELGKRVRAAREARGWSQDELAFLADIGVETLRELERAERQRSPELFTAARIAAALEVDRLDDLMPAEWRILLGPRLSERFGQIAVGAPATLAGRKSATGSSPSSSARNRSGRKRRTIAFRPNYKSTLSSLRQHEQERIRLRWVA